MSSHNFELPMLTEVDTDPTAPTHRCRVALCACHSAHEAAQRLEGAADFLRLWADAEGRVSEEPPPVRGGFRGRLS